MREAATHANDDEPFAKLGLHAERLIRSLKQKTKADGLGDALPIDQQRENDDVDRGPEGKHPVERKADDAKRMTA